jgi:hypothetical protein
VEVATVSQQSPLDNRRATSSLPEDSGTRPSQLSEADIEALRSKFPILSELSTGFIRNLSAIELLSLE